MERKRQVTRVTLLAACVITALGLHGCGEMDRDAAASSEATACTVVAAGGSWWNQSFAEQRGRFHVELDATPSTYGIDAVIGLSDGSATHWNRLAAIIRFNPAGTIDARAGGEYRADQQIRYEPGTIYHVRFDVDMSTRTYSAWVRPSWSGAYFLIGRDYPFRTEQAAITRLTNISSFVNFDRGAVELCGVSVVADGTTADGCTINTAGAGFANTAVTSSNRVMLVDVDATAGQANQDAVFGVANGPVDAYNDYAASIRFFTNGMIEARDGNAYRADAVVAYRPGDRFKLRFVIDLPTKTYSVFVQGPGISVGEYGNDFVELARNYRFRGEQLQVGSLDHVATIVASSTGRIDACGAGGGPAGAALYARRGSFSIAPAPADAVVISDGTKTDLINATGANQWSVPRGGAPVVDPAGNVYLVRTDNGALAVDALSSAGTLRWSRSYPIAATVIVSSAVFASGELGIASGDGAEIRVTRITSDGTVVGSSAFPGSGVAVGAAGYVLLIPHAGGYTFERHEPAGGLVWSRSYDGPYSVSDLVAGPDGSVVFAGAHSEGVDFGLGPISHFSNPDADNTFVARLAPTGEATFSHFADATWFGGLATTGTHVAWARQKHIGPIINEFHVVDASGAYTRFHADNGLSSFGRSYRIALSPGNRVYTSGEMEWPGFHDAWPYFVALSP